MDLLNIDNAKSYSTEKRLQQALKKTGLNDTRCIVVLNREGRYTAIFTAAQCEISNIPMGHPAHCGYPVVN